MSADADAAPSISESDRTRLAEATVPQFRAVGKGDQRRGIRLEKVFWDVLDALAARRKKKRSDLVGELLDKSDDNAASRLRCYLVMAIDAERQHLFSRDTPDRSIPLMQQAPVPAFAITRQKRLQQVNNEFMQFLRVASGTLTGKLSPEHVHLTLDTAIEELFAKLAVAPHSAFCGYSLVVDSKRRQGRVKVVPVPTEPVEVLVGYIVS